jgi:hypothetical protein
MYFHQKSLNLKFLNKWPLLFKALLMVKMYVFLLMDKLVQERHIQWRDLMLLKYNLIKYQKKLIQSLMVYYQGQLYIFLKR